MSDDEQAIVNDYFDKRESLAEQHQTELEVKTEKRKARLRQLSEASGQVMIQAFGTLVGGGMLFLAASMAGILQRTTTNTWLAIVAAVVPALVGIAAGYSGMRVSTNALNTAISGSLERDLMSRLEAARYKETPEEDDD